MTENRSGATIELMRIRRSVAPAFLDGPAPMPDEINGMLALATRVPDHGKLVPWRFILFQGKARERAGEIIQQIYHADNPGASAEKLAQESSRLALAPLVIAIVSRAAPHVKIPEWEQVMSAGAVAMNLTLAANAYGFSTAWLTEWYSYDRRVLERFGLAPHEKIAGFIHIGRASIVPGDRVRPALSEITTQF